MGSGGRGAFCAPLPKESGMAGNGIRQLCVMEAEPKWHAAVRAASGAGQSPLGDGQDRMGSAGFRCENSRSQYWADRQEIMVQGVIGTVIIIVLFYFLKVETGICNFWSAAQRQNGDYYEKQAFNPYLPSYEYVSDGEPYGWCAVGKRML